MMRRYPAILALLLAVACAAPPAQQPRERLRVADVLGSGGAGQGFARAREPRPFVFPADHGAHPEYAAEWWYFTGNLDSPAGARFGFQLTFFRTALVPPAELPSRTSAWAADQVWMAHFAVTDVDGGRFWAFDRFQRGALDLAGARSEPWRVWLDDWSLQQVGDQPFPLRLRAHQGLAAGGDGAPRIALDLTVDPRKPIVLQGERGLSRKGPTPGNASYYYSLTRLAASGTLQLGEQRHEVSGSAWLDREWSTSVLESGQVGWDWFALQLDDGSELMYYQIRSADGAPAPQSAGILVRPDGSSDRLAAADVELTVDARWQSPRDGALYPAEWTLTVARHGIALRITPLLADQELDLAFRYWEGAVAVTGAGVGGTPVGGRGYVELTGYAEGGSRP